MWVREHWNGFEDNFAPEKDWWEKIKEVPKKGKRKRGGKRRQKAEDEETEDLGGQHPKRLRREEVGYITPVPLSRDEFKAMFG